MANAVVAGLISVPNVKAEQKFHATLEELVSADAIVIGTPTYHHDTSNEMKKLLEEIAFKAISLKGKIGASFGSYGWSGEAPHLALEVMENKLEMKVIKPPLLIMYTPDEKGLEECRNFGKKIGEQISQLYK